MENGRLEREGKRKPRGRKGGQKIGEFHYFLFYNLTTAFNFSEMFT